MVQLIRSFQRYTFSVIDANPFLQKVQKQLSSRLQRMPEMYSVTSVLNAWVSYGLRGICLIVSCTSLFYFETGVKDQ